MAIDTGFCSSFAFTKENMKDCVSCTEPMNGIYSYEIRETCNQCGGKAKE